MKAYHGVTIVAASLTGLPNNHRDFDLPVDASATPPPRTSGRAPSPARPRRTSPRRLAAELDALILAEGPDTVAAFIAEPVMGAGGVIVPPEGYFAAIDAVCRKYDVLMIADEVICGFGRTGEWFGDQTLDFPPTSMSMAKQLTAGFLPLSAVAIDTRHGRGIEANSGKIGTFGHGYTYGGHPVACAVGVKALEIYHRIDVPARVRRLAPRFAAHLDRLSGHPLVGEARVPRPHRRPRARPGQVADGLRAGGQGRRPGGAGADRPRRHRPRHRRHPRLLPADDDHRGRDRRDVRPRRGRARRHREPGPGPRATLAEPDGAPGAMNPLRGIGLKILSVCVFTMMAICIKASAPHVPPGEAVFFRSFFAIPVIVAWLAWPADLRHGLDTLYPMGHVWRGLVGTSAMGLGFTALGLLPLPEATALGYAAPLLIVIFAAMFLGEEVRIFRLTAVAVGLVGVVIVLWPRLTVTPSRRLAAETIGAMAALLGAVFAALAQVFVRKLIKTEGTPGHRLLLLGTASVLSLLTLPFGWVVPDRRRGAAPRRRRLARRHRPDPADRELPPRRGRRDRAVRVRLDAPRPRPRLPRSSTRSRPSPCWPARADRRRRPLHHLARAQARPPARRRAQGHHPAG